MQKALWLIFLSVSLNFSSLIGQELDHVPGEFLLLLRSADDAFLLQKKVRKKTPAWRHFHISTNPIFGRTGFLAKINPNQVHERNLLAWLRHQPEVTFAQFNHLLNWRATTPNDPLFDQQWHYINLGNQGGVLGFDLDADLAWDINTGGVTPSGDTIVVAVIDNGIYPDHPDLGNNMWVNHQEIPNNQVDDDGNGYIDDYSGWNITTQNDLIDPLGISGHGTSVAGMIGAKGNNGIGVSGINWDVKLLIISNPESFTEARALQAYAYVHKMRELYNETDGEKGAYIVASNASWGKDFAFPEDAPIWCDMYEKLGKVGVLNCGATSNLNVDVDVVGDLPSTCPSNYLIAVTNLNNSGLKVTKAGYGKEHIDLGSFGEGAFTISRPSEPYKPFQGTSAASPQVAGAIALLYSAPCYELTDLSKSDPAAAALLARDYILDGIHNNTNLNNVTATGGQLNLFNSMQLAVDACGSCPVPQEAQGLLLSGTEILLDWSLPYYSAQSTIRYRLKGSNIWTHIENVVPPYTLSGLEPCKNYEVQLKSLCSNEESGFSPTLGLQSGDCCTPPAHINILDLSEESIQLEWPLINSADQYYIKYRQIGATDWQDSTIDQTIITLDGLSPCQEFELDIESICSILPSLGLSETFFFRTKGCGACRDLDYCMPQGDTKYEWIKRVQINDMEQSSNASDGYQSYQDQTTTLFTHQKYDVELEAASTGIPLKENFRIWIDYNQDGDFLDLEELVFNSRGTGLQQGKIKIPPTALTGTTRLRVGMSYANGPVPSPCGLNYQGEVEDYCVNILEGSPSCDLPVNLDTLEITEDYLLISWEDPTDDHSSHNIRYRPLSMASVWTEELNVEPPHFITDISPCETYVIQVEANCSDSSISGYGAELEVNSLCNSGIVPNPGISHLKEMPNPFREYLELAFFLDKSSPIRLQLFSLDGSLDYDKEFMDTSSGLNELFLDDISSLAAGLYLLRLQCATGAAQVKVLKY